MPTVGLTEDAGNRARTAPLRFADRLLADGLGKTHDHHEEHSRHRANAGNGCGDIAGRRRKIELWLDASSRRE